MFATNNAHTQPVCLMSIYTRLPENAVPALPKESVKELCPKTDACQYVIFEELHRINCLDCVHHRQQRRPLRNYTSQPPCLRKSRGS